MSPTTTEFSSSWPARWWHASATRISDDADLSQQAERLEHMRSEFLVAQQRRRNQSPRPADRPVDTDDDPLGADERSDASATVVVGTLQPRS